MIKIITVGVVIENNFGSPSILHGIEELVKIFHDEYYMTHYQDSKLSNKIVSDMSFNIIKYSGNPKRLIWNALKDRIGIRIKHTEDKEIIKKIKEADIVMDAFGILFCDNFTRVKYSYYRMVKNCIGRFYMLFIAKLYGKKTVKTPSSFGPMKEKFNWESAKFCCKHLFDVVCARESKSREALINDAKVKSKILLSPDIANLMKYRKSDDIQNRPVGISVSHQIIRQWGADEAYIDCIVSLCEHIKENHGVQIILIPNELSEEIYDDMSVAQDIKEACKIKGFDVDISDAINMSSTDLKNCIASCEVLIASRYHSCVAALSSGVPTLVVGWHYKYEELLHWYGQDNWILSNENCTSEKLKSMFDCFWERRENERKVIAEKYSDVYNALIEVGKVIFSKYSIKE
ncbi:MAG: polysaccharide pyruvyl transferase family protein [Lutisporaceae bacterium]